MSTLYTKQEEKFQRRLIHQLPEGYRDHVEETVFRKIENSVQMLKEAYLLNDQDALFFYLGQVLDLLDVKVALSEEVARTLYDVLFSVVAESNNVVVLKKALNVYATFIRRKKWFKATGVEYIDWKVLYNRFESVCLKKWPIPGYVGDGTHASSLKRVFTMSIQRARRFFSPDAVDEILEYVSPMMCIHDVRIFEAASIFNLFMPVTNDKYHLWIDYVFKIWGLFDSNKKWDSCWITLLARLAKEKAGKIDWSPYQKFFTSKFIQTTQLASGENNLSSLSSPSFPSFYDFSEGGFHYDKLFAYTIDESSVETLKQAIMQFSSYFNPANSGKWTMILLSFLRKLLYHINKRVCLEKKGKIGAILTKSDHLLDEIHGILLPLVESSLSLEKHVSSVPYIAKLNAEKTFNSLKKRVIFSLVTDSATKQISPGINTSSVLVPFCYELDEFKQNLVEIMYLTLPGIDINDFKKTNKSFKYFYGVFLYHRISDDMCLEYGTEPDRFSEWADRFLDQILNFLEHIRDDSPDDFSTLFKLTMRQFFMQVSDEILENMLQKIREYVSGNSNKLALKYFGQIVTSVVRVNPERGLEVFSSFINGTVNSKGKLKSKNTEWRIKLLGKIVRFTGSAVLPYLPKITEIIGLAVADDRKKIANSGRKLLTYTLKCLTSYYPIEYRSGNDGMDLDIQWHQPTQTCIEKAREISQHFVTLAIEKLNEVLDKQQNTHIERYTSLIRAVLVGSNLYGLLDPDQPKTDSGVPRVGLKFSTDIFEIEKLDVSDIVDISHRLTEYIIQLDLPVQIRCIFKLLVVLLSQRGFNPSKGNGLKRTNYMLKVSFGMYGYKEEKLPRPLRINTAEAKHYSILEDKLVYAEKNESYKMLLDDLINLYVQHFGALKNATGSVSDCIKRVPLISGSTIFALIKKIGSPIDGDSDKEFKAISALLANDYIISRISRKPRMAISLMENIIRASLHNKGSEQKALFTLFNRLCSVLTTFDFTTVNYNLRGSHLSSNDIEKITNFLKNQNEGTIKMLEDVVQFLSDTINDNSSHWRYKYMAASLISIHLGTNEIINEMSLTSSFNLLQSSEMPKSIKLGIEFVSAVLQQRKSKYMSKTIEISDIKYDEDVSDYDNFPFIDKLYAAWNGNRLSLPVERIEKDMAVQNFIRETFTLEYSKDLIDKIQRNRDKDVKSPKTSMESIFSTFSSMMPSHMKFGNRKAKSQPNINLHKTNTFNKSSQHRRRYKTENRFFTFWRLIFEYYGPSYLSLILDFLLEILNKNEETMHTTVAEIFGGALRAMKYYTSSECEEIIPSIKEIVRHVKKAEISSDCVTDFCSAIRFGVSDLDPRRFRFLEETLFSENILGENQTSQIQTKSLRLLNSLMEEFSWRGKHLIEKVLNYLENKLDHPYAQVRETIAELLGTICSITLEVDLEKSTLERHVKNGKLVVDFLQRILSKLMNAKNSNYSNETLLRFLNSTIKNQSLTPGFLFMIIPKLLELQNDKEQTTRDMSKVGFTLMSQLSLTTSELNQLLNILTQFTDSNDWKLFGPLCLFIQIISFNHSVFLEKDDITLIFDYLVSLLDITKIEVADSAMQSISSLIRITNVRGTGDVSRLLDNFKELVNTEVPKEKSTKKSALRKIRKGLLGLSAIARAFPYSVPEYLPEILVIVSSFTTMQRPLNRISNDCINEFWRTHQNESWELYYADKFTTQDLEKIRNTTTPSYFA
eukprot:TRINITY_DN7008_c0_g1_i1.p1 TRINITY_DN7008_c0_g1~~TRINITY_DN7008_c0_g1_i1.p1  ORF type:complete len:1713 (-),score=331.42 TRINITY_DN7008_c0_g1_i1:41-5179(-)